MGICAYICSPIINREVSEWLKEHAWKVCKRETVSRVRIPSSLQYVMKQNPDYVGVFLCPSSSLGTRVPKREMGHKKTGHVRAQVLLHLLLLPPPLGSAQLIHRRCIAANPMGKAQLIPSFCNKYL